VYRERDTERDPKPDRQRDDQPSVSSTHGDTSYFLAGQFVKGEVA
jgi:hypothetical protein